MKVIQSLTPSEKDIQRTILAYLSYAHIMHWREQSGAFKTDAGGFYRTGVPGIPDIFCVVRGRLIGLEVKRKGGKQSPAQKDFQKRLEVAGGLYFLVQSVDEVKKIIEL